MHANPDRRRLTAGRLVVAGLLVATTVGIAIFVELLLSHTRDSFLRLNATQHAHHWAANLKNGIPRLREAFATQELDEEQINKIIDTQNFGEIFLFKLYSPDGTEFYSSNVEFQHDHAGHHHGDDHERETLEAEAHVDDFDHTSLAAETARTGQATVFLKQGTEANDRPSLYAEALIPVRSLDGSIIGTMEVYINQTALKTALDESFSWLGIALPLLAVFVYAVPATGAFVISAQKKNRDIKLAHARLDPLTGILSRGALTEDALRMFDEVAGRSNRIGMLFVDLDHFKRINDEYGHKTGDAVLVGQVERMREVCREHDVLGRFGGDEFVALLPGVDETTLNERAGDLADALCRPMLVGEHELAVSGSVGASLFRPSTTTFEQALAIADASLFKAKAAGRGRAVVSSTLTPPKPKKRISAA